MQPLHVDQLIEGTHVIYTGRTSVDRVAFSEPAEEGHILMEGHPGRIWGCGHSTSMWRFSVPMIGPSSSRGFARDDNGTTQGRCHQGGMGARYRAGWWT